MPKYRKKPVIIEAIRWNGDNGMEVSKFYPGRSDNLTEDNSLQIYTLEGTMKCSVGDFLIKGVAGEFYPCKADIFEKTYELVEDATVSELTEFSKNNQQ